MATTATATDTPRAPPSTTASDTPRAPPTTTAGLAGPAASAPGGTAANAATPQYQDVFAEIERMKHGSGSMSDHEETEDPFAAPKPTLDQRIAAVTAQLAQAPPPPALPESQDVLPLPTLPGTLPESQDGLPMESQLPLPSVANADLSLDDDDDSSSEEEATTMGNHEGTREQQQQQQGEEEEEEDEELALARMIRAEALLNAESSDDEENDNDDAKKQENDATATTTAFTGTTAPSWTDTPVSTVEPTLVTTTSDTATLLHDDDEPMAQEPMAPSFAGAPLPEPPRKTVEKIPLTAQQKAAVRARRALLDKIRNRAASVPVMGRKVWRATNPVPEAVPLPPLRGGKGLDAHLRHERRRRDSPRKERRPKKRNKKRPTLSSSGFVAGVPMIVLSEEALQAEAVPPPLPETDDDISQQEDQVDAVNMDIEEPKPDAPDQGQEPEEAQPEEEPASQAVPVAGESANEMSLHMSFPSSFFDATQVPGEGTQDVTMDNGPLVDTNLSSPAVTQSDQPQSAVVSPEPAQTSLAPDPSSPDPVSAPRIHASAFIDTEAGLDEGAEAEVVGGAKGGEEVIAPETEEDRQFVVDDAEELAMIEALGEDDDDEDEDEPFVQQEEDDEELQRLKARFLPESLRDSLDQQSPQNGTPARQGQFALVPRAAPDEDLATAVAATSNGRLDWRDKLMAREAEGVQALVAKMKSQDDSDSDLDGRMGDQDDDVQIAASKRRERERARLQLFIDERAEMHELRTLPSPRVSDLDASSKQMLQSIHRSNRAAGVTPSSDVAMATSLSAFPTRGALSRASSSNNVMDMSMRLSRSVSRSAHGAAKAATSGPTNFASLNKELDRANERRNLALRGSFLGSSLSSVVAEEEADIGVHEGDGTRSKRKRSAHGGAAAAAVAHGATFIFRRQGDSRHGVAEANGRSKSKRSAVPAKSGSTSFSASAFFTSSVPSLSRNVSSSNGKRKRKKVDLMSVLAKRKRRRTKQF